MKLTLLTLLCCAMTTFQCTSAADVSRTKAGAARKLSTAAPSKSPADIAAPSLDNASWIWHSENEPLCHFRKVFVLAQPVQNARLLITADNGYELYVNGSLVGADAGVESVYWQSVEAYDITRLLTLGRNVIAVRASDMGGRAGLIAAARVVVAADTSVEIVTDDSWRVTRNADPTGYAESGFKENSEWEAARVLGPMGIEPWGKVTFPGPTSPAHTAGTSGAISEAQKDFYWPDGIIFVRGRVPQSSDPTAPQAIWRIGNSRAYLEFDTLGPAMLGHSLYALRPVRSNAKPQLLVNAGKGLIGSPSVSFDGSEILFSMVKEGEKFFHIYRIQSTGGPPQALTHGPFHDFDPEPLPDGKIVFSSTRAGHREEYHGNSARTLFVMNSDGGDIRALTHHIVGDNEPRVTASGQIAFIRQDNFMERAKVETHVHAVRPDGTGGQVLLGPDRQAIGYDTANAAEVDSRWLRSYGYGSLAALPDGRVAAISGYGLVFSGNEVMPPATVRPAVDLVDISPLPDGRLLCTTAGLGLGVLDPASGKIVRIYDKDVLETHSVAHLGPRPKPGLARATVDSTSENAVGSTGFLLGQNVFYTKQTNAEMSRVKAIRVVQGNPFTTRSARHPYAHLGVEAVELGTVPLAADGSFYVEVPADRALMLQAVDGEGRSVVNELSWIYVRPGEQRSCVGCHTQREAAPPNQSGVLALRGGPIRLLGEGQPHRFRGNNAANGGVLNLQFDRFREAASINFHARTRLSGDDDELPARESERKAWAAELKSDDVSLRISALQRLAIFRDRAVAPQIASALHDENSRVRMNAALALSACGTRESIAPLLAALSDGDFATAQAANRALENLTGHSVASNYKPNLEAWKNWFSANDWRRIESALIRRLAGKDPADVQVAIDALGHVGSEIAKRTLWDFLAHDSEQNLRASLAAIRALGHLHDTNAVKLLSGILNQNVPMQSRKAAGSHEFGWLQRPVQLAAAAAEALGWIGTSEAEHALIDACARLEDFTYYTLQNGDHEWLKGCHSSLPHYRIAEALDAMGSRDIAKIIPAMLKSVPIDTDRALLFENDDYETIIGRLVNRSGLAHEVIETCLAVLAGETATRATPITEAVTNSPPAVSVGPLDPESRAAQLLSIVCLDPRNGPEIRAAFDRYRAHSPSRTRSWVCFYLGRTLGNLRDVQSANSLIAALEKDATEASFGLVDPPNVFLDNAMTPCYRAAAAHALGHIGDRRATSPLLKAVGNFDNAMDVRNAAAHALALLRNPDHLAELQKLASDYPEIATRRVLLEACAGMGTGTRSIRSVSQRSH